MPVPKLCPILDNSYGEKGGNTRMRRSRFAHVRTHKPISAKYGEVRECYLCPCLSAHGNNPRRSINGMGWTFPVLGIPNRGTSANRNSESDRGRSPQLITHVKAIETCADVRVDSALADIFF